MLKKLFTFSVVMLILCGNAFAATPQIDFTPTVQGDFKIQVDITTDFPDGSVLSVSISKHGLGDDDIFVGTDFIKVPVKNGSASVLIDAEKRARPSIAAITKGKYELDVTFYPRWKENKLIADNLGIKEPVEIVKIIQLVGNGQGEEAFQEQKQTLEGRNWVMGEVFQGMKWDESFWVKKFGQPERYSSSVGNNKVLQMYYFEKIDMTIMVNTLKKEIVTWRNGKALQ